jgi:hypothetical protein
VPDRFSNVVASGGRILERIDQSQLYSTEDAGALCVSLSTLWMGHSATTSGPFADTLPRVSAQYSEATDFARTRMHAVKNAMHAQVDTALKVWEARSAALDMLRWEANRRKPKGPEQSLPPVVVNAVTTLVRTRSSTPMTWPPALDADKDALSSVALTTLVTNLETAYPIPLPKVEDLITYDFVNTFVGAWTRNRYPNLAHAPFAGRPVPVLDVIDGYRLLVIYSLSRLEGEVIAFRGHMMALRDTAEGRTLFDPNCGIVFFKDPARFRGWFQSYTEDFYGKAFRDGGFVKTFWVSR